jgi:hypothetical protein
LNRERWFEIVAGVGLAVTGCLGVFYQWGRLAFLFLFPTVFPFSYFLVRKPYSFWRRVLGIKLALVHCLVLVAACALWQFVEVVRVRADWAVGAAFGLVVLESLVGEMLLRGARLSQPALRESDVQEKWGINRTPPESRR